MKKYQVLVQNLKQRIQQGEIAPGARIPSIRNLSRQSELSKNTVIRALAELEDEQFIEALPRQGFIVCPPRQSPTRLEPKKVSLGATAFSVLGEANQQGKLALGSAYPDGRWPTVSWYYKQHARVAKQWAQQAYKRQSHYSTPPGDPSLRETLAEHLSNTAFNCTSNDIVITQGAQEAVSLCLHAVAQAGDIIAVESPCYYGTLQCIEALGLRVLELPSDPLNGTNLDALEDALKEWPIKAVLTNPSYNNPLGFNLSLENRQRLLKLANQWDIAIIEDDVFGELSYNHQRPTPLKAIDSEQRVLYCGSLSKTIDVDIRVGWVLPGRYYDRINYYKFVTSIACPALIQQSVAELLKGRRYRRHLKQITVAYAERSNDLLEDVKKLWPRETLMIPPKGGILQWFELPNVVDSDALFKQALAQEIGIAPGNLFCADQRFNHHIRLCYAHYTRTPEQQKAIAILGEMIADFT